MFSISFYYCMNGFSSKREHRVQLCTSSYGYTFASFAFAQTPSHDTRSLWRSEPCLSRSLYVLRAMVQYYCAPIIEQSMI